MRMALSLAVAALAAAASLPAATQTIYRCGNEYTRVPCANGKAVEADAGAVESRRVAEARQGAARERKLADDMARDRRANEKALRPAKATSLGPAKAVEPPVAASASMKPKKKARGKIRVVDERDFVATVPKVKAK